jgi:ABC-type polysaccharide/polyol phosphate transport system ATPase subunit
MVSALCTRALFLDRGVMKKIGPTDEVVSEYTSTVLQPETTETAGSASD